MHRTVYRNIGWEVFWTKLKEGSVFPSQISWEELVAAERDEFLAIDRPFNPTRSGFPVTL